MATWAQNTPVVHSLGIPDAIGLAGFGVAMAGVIGYLPIAVAVFAGLAGGISYTLTIIRDPIVQMWVAKRRFRRQTRQLKRLKLKQVLVVAQIEALERVSQVKAETGEQVDVLKQSTAQELKKL